MKSIIFLFVFLHLICAHETNYLKGETTGQTGNPYQTYIDAYCEEVATQYANGNEQQKAASLDDCKKVYQNYPSCDFTEIGSSIIFSGYQVLSQYSNTCRLDCINNVYSPNIGDQTKAIMSYNLCTYLEPEVKDQVLIDKISESCNAYTHVFVQGINETMYQGTMTEEQYTTVMQQYLPECYEIYSDYPKCDYTEMGEATNTVLQNLAKLSVSQAYCRLDCIDNVFVPNQNNPEAGTLYYQCALIPPGVTDQTLISTIKTSCEGYVSSYIFSMRKDLTEDSFRELMQRYLPECYEIYRNYPRCDYEEMAAANNPTFKNLAILRTSHAYCRLDCIDNVYVPNKNNPAAGTLYYQCALIPPGVTDKELITHISESCNAYTDNYVQGVIAAVGGEYKTLMQEHLPECYQLYRNYPNCNYQELKYAENTVLQKFEGLSGISNKCRLDCVDNVYVPNKDDPAVAATSYNTCTYLEPEVTDQTLISTIKTSCEQYTTGVTDATTKSALLDDCYKIYRNYPICNYTEVSESSIFSSKDFMSADECRLDCMEEYDALQTKTPLDYKKCAWIPYGTDDGKKAIIKGACDQYTAGAPDDATKSALLEECYEIYRNYPRCDWKEMAAANNPTFQQFSRLNVTKGYCRLDCISNVYLPNMNDPDAGTLYYQCALIPPGMTDPDLIDHVKTACEGYTHVFVEGINEKIYQGTMTEEEYKATMQQYLPECYEIYSDYPKCDYAELKNAESTLWQSFAGLSSYKTECSLKAIEQYDSTNPEESQYTYFLTTSGLADEFEDDTRAEDKTKQRCYLYSHLSLAGSDEYSKKIDSYITECYGIYSNGDSCNWQELATSNIQTFNQFAALSALTTDCRLDCCEKYDPNNPIESQQRFFECAIDLTIEEKEPTKCERITDEEIQKAKQKNPNLSDSEQKELQTQILSECNDLYSQYPRCKWQKLNQSSISKFKDLPLESLIDSDCRLDCIEEYDALETKTTLDYKKCSWLSHETDEEKKTLIKDACEQHTAHVTDKVTKTSFLEECYEIYRNYPRCDYEEMESTTLFKDLAGLSATKGYCRLDCITDKYLPALENEDTKDAAPMTYYQCALIPPGMTDENLIAHVKGSCEIYTHVSVQEKEGDYSTLLQEYLPECYELYSDYPKCDYDDLKNAKGSVWQSFSAFSQMKTDCRLDCMEAYEEQNENAKYDYYRCSYPEKISSEESEMVNYNEFKLRANLVCPSFINPTIDGINKNVYADTMNETTKIFALNEHLPNCIDIYANYPYCKYDDLASSRNSAFKQLSALSATEMDCRLDCMEKYGSSENAATEYKTCASVEYSYVNEYQDKIDEICNEKVKDITDGTEKESATKNCHRVFRNYPECNYIDLEELSFYENLSFDELADVECQLDCMEEYDALETKTTLDYKKCAWLSHETDDGKKEIIKDACEKYTDESSLKECYKIYRNYPRCDYEEMKNSKNSLFQGLAALSSSHAYCRLDCMNNIDLPNVNDPATGTAYHECALMPPEVKDEELKSHIKDSCEVFSKMYVEGINSAMYQNQMTEGTRDYIFQDVLPGCYEAHKIYPDCEWNDLKESNNEVLNKLYDLKKLGTKCRLDCMQKYNSETPELSQKLYVTCSNIPSQDICNYDIAAETNGDGNFVKTEILKLLYGAAFDLGLTCHSQCLEVSEEIETLEDLENKKESWMLKYAACVQNGGPPEPGESTQIQRPEEYCSWDEVRKTYSISDEAMAEINRKGLKCIGDKKTGTQNRICLEILELTTSPVLYESCISVNNPDFICEFNTMNIPSAAALYSAGLICRIDCLVYLEMGVGVYQKCLEMEPGSLCSFDSNDYVEGSDIYNKYYFKQKQTVCKKNALFYLDEERYNSVDLYKKAIEFDADQICDFVEYADKPEYFGAASQDPLLYQALIENIHKQKIVCRRDCVEQGHLVVDEEKFLEDFTKEFTRVITKYGSCCHIRSELLCNYDTYDVPKESQEALLASKAACRTECIPMLSDEETKDDPANYVVCATLKIQTNPLLKYQLLTEGRTGYMAYYGIYINGELHLTGARTGDYEIEYGFPRSPLYQWRNHIKKLVIHENMVYLGSGLLFYQKGLEEVVIPEGVQYVVNNTFYGCTSVKTLTLPSTLHTLGLEPFYAMNNLTDIIITNPEKANLTVDDKGVLYSRDYKTLYLFPPAKKMEEYTVHRDCEKIHFGAFGWSPMKEIHLSPNIKELGAYAFELNAYLKKLIVPKGVQQISPAILLYVSSLEELVWLGNITFVGQHGISQDFRLKTFNYFGSEIPPLSTCVQMTIYYNKALEYINMLEQYKSKYENETICSIPLRFTLTEAERQKYQDELDSYYD